MPYDPEIEARIRAHISNWPGTSAKKMFGGVCHLLNGNMFCGVHKEYIILRLGEKAAAEALGLEHVKPFDITGRPMKGWVMVSGAGLESEAELEAWLQRARRFADTLPPK